MDINKIKLNEEYLWHQPGKFSVYVIFHGREDPELYGRVVDTASSMNGMQVCFNLIECENYIQKVAAPLPPEEPQKTFLSESDKWFCNNLTGLIDLQRQLINDNKQAEIDRNLLYEWIKKHSLYGPEEPKAEEEKEGKTAEEIIEENTFVKDGLMTVEHAAKCAKLYAQQSQSTPISKDKLKKLIEDTLKGYDYDSITNLYNSGYHFGVHHFAKKVLDFLNNPNP